MALVANTPLDSSESYDVIIVGGGPVGMALAAELGQRRVRCLVVERNLEVGRIPKGQNLTQRSLEHFYFWRCVDELRQARPIPSELPIGGLTAYGSLTSGYAYSPPGREVVRDFYFQSNERLPQYLTEQVLRERVAELESVTCLLGWSACSIDPRGDGVRVTIEPTALQGDRRMVEGSYVVGCDGARSTVREAACIGREGHDDLEHAMVLAVFRARELDRGLTHFPPRTTYRILKPELRGLWQFFGRVDKDETWFFHSPIDENVPLDAPYVRSLIEAAAGFPVPALFDHIGLWNCRIQVAQTYHDDRVFIAGDACHTHPPYGGFGLNTGLEDVVNLGWKLNAVLRGWGGGGSLLSTYTEERRPIFVETGQLIANGIALDRAFLETYDPDRDRGEFEAAWERRSSQEQGAASYEPHYSGSSIVCGERAGGIGVQGSHSFQATAGHHLAPLPLSDGTNVFEKLGGDFTLLAFGADDEAVGEARKITKALGVPTRIVRDEWCREVQRLGARWILVRPDQYVAWAGDEAPSDARSVIARAVGRSEGAAVIN